MLASSTPMCKNILSRKSINIMKTYKSLKNIYTNNTQIYMNPLLPRTFDNGRLLSTENPGSVVKPQWIVSDHEVRKFKSYFREVLRDLTDGSPYADIPEFTKRFARVLEYNVPHGKQHRALLVVDAYKTFESPENLTTENIRLANILGWCLEMFQASMLVEDDILDVSTFRRGKACWYTVAGIQAINDARLIESGCCLLLAKYFSDHEFYIPIIELYNDIFMKTRIGELLDQTSSVIGKQQLSNFTMEMFNTIAHHKTGYQAFYLPITFAMYLARKRYPEMQNPNSNIILELGRFFQVENDIFDFFGNPARTGKRGTDIKKGQCTWLAVEALQRATTAQRQLLIDNYGKTEPDCEIAVQNVYQELNLLEIYSEYRRNAINVINAYIYQMKNAELRTCMNKLFKELQKNYDETMLSK